MTVILPLLGSRGDVQPGLALAAELTRRGHTVDLSVPPNLLALARSAGLPARALGPDSRALLEGELVQVRRRSPDPRVRLRALSEIGTLGWRRLAADLDGPAAGAEAIVTSFLGQEVAAALAERHGLTQVALHYFPVRPAHSVTLLPERLTQIPGVGPAAWSATGALWRALTRREEDRMRADLGLGPSPAPVARRMTAAGVVEIQAYDPLLFPGLAAEWGTRRPLVGFLDLPGPATADTELDRWLEAGAAPLYWGFGSMPVRDPAGTVALVREVSARLGRRALLCAGWSTFGGVGDDPALAIVPSVDHARVLPRCVAAVHHGGAGTTAATLRAGIPSLVAAFGADQQFWGRRLAQLGVGAVTRVDDLDVATAISTLGPLLGDRPARRARELAATLNPPDRATAAAADLVERAIAAGGVRSTRTSARAATHAVAAPVSVDPPACAAPVVMTLPVRPLAPPPSPPAPAPVLRPVVPGRTATPAAVHAHGLSCRFGDRTVVDSVDFEIEAGTVFGLLGPNGAGKTTLVRMLATLQPPAGGSATVFGHDIVADPHRVRALIALTGQYAAVDEDLTARENLLIFARLRGFSRPAARRRAGELLEAFTLADSADRSLRNFSGGMRRRLDLAASMIARPPLLFLDEPTTGLDPRTRVHLWETVRTLVADGTTVLLTTQYLEEADQLADRIAVIDHGRLVAEGTADALKASVGRAGLRLVVVEAGDLDAAVAAVGRRLGREVARLDARSLSVALSDTAAVTDVLLALRELGIAVEEVVVQKPTLDEVFFELTAQPAAAFPAADPAPAALEVAA